MKKETLSVRKLTRIAILSALAASLMMIEFQLPIAPSFYKMDFSEVAVLFGGFALGPMAAIWIEALKIIINTLITGTTTAYVGEFANFIIGLAMSLPAAIIYKRNKSKKSALLGLILGTIMMCIVGYLLNVYVVIPAYVKIAHYPLDAIIGMGNAIFKSVVSVKTLALFCTTPFNLIKGIMVSLITFISYKKISPLLK